MHPAADPDAPPPLRVLVADDRRDSADSLAALVGLWGYESDVVYDHVKVIDRCRDFRPDVLLLDIGMPLRTDGLAVARAAREELDDDLAIAAVTGFEDDFTREEAARAGFDFFFVKPLDPDTLRRFLAARDARPKPQRQ